MNNRQLATGKGLVKYLLNEQLYYYDASVMSPMHRPVILFDLKNKEAQRTQGAQRNLVKHFLCG